MKSVSKLIIATLLTVCSFSLLNAQIGLGVRGAFNYATAELEEKVGDSWETDMQDYIFLGSSGFLLEFNLNDKFALQPELNYIQKGYKTGVVIENVTRDVKTVLNYVELPFLVKGKFGPGRVKFNALVGPSFGYAFNGKLKSDIADADIDFKDAEVKRWDIGAVLGVGASMDAGPGALFLDARLGWGFSNLDDSANSDNYNWHNRGVNVGIGYVLAIGN
jgi:Outer membrane protein beta-barrel domain